VTPIHDAQVEGAEHEIDAMNGGLCSPMCSEVAITREAQCLAWKGLACNG
jgi:hypothetical protein